jgi:pimeloyl-ACP methyl ester carboxylesterase
MERFRGGWPGQSSAEVHFYRSKTVQYRYRERGNGPVILFTADPPVTLECYDELLARYASAFRVVIVELPAMGFSATQSDYSFRFRETNDDLASFIREVCGDGATLAFSCVAGLAAVDIACRYPELAARLILMQTGDVAAFARWKAARDPKGILATPLFGQWAMKRMVQKRMPDWYRLSVGNKAKIDHFCRCAEESFAHGALWSLASAYQIYMDAGITLAQPHQPILAIWGEADRSHPPENMRSPLNFAPQVEYVAIPNLGHFAELEDVDQIHRLITDFIARNYAGSAGTL